MQRYFVEMKNNEFVLTNEQLHQIKNVMRNRVGDELVFIQNQDSYKVQITCLSPFQVDIEEKMSIDTELKKDIVLLYCLAKKDKIDFVIQKATELGVKKIVLVNSSRSIFKIKKEDEGKKISRYEKIALEASEQCGRAVVPSIEGVIDFKDIGNYTSDISFIAYEKETSLTLNETLLQKVNSISILIGSEGGFSLEEVNYASDVGYKSLSLGKRILRTETAAIYALSILSHYVEE